MINKKKEEIQEAAYQAWLAAGKIGTVEQATGTGKTFVAFKCILSMPKGSNILFLAETVVREATVREDADKYEKFYGVHPLKDYNFKFATYQGAYKYKLLDYFPKATPQDTLVVMDEIHDILSDKRIEFVDNSMLVTVYNPIGFTWFPKLGLSATIDKKTKYQVQGLEITKVDLLKKFCPIVYTYSLQDSIDNGTTRDLKFFVLKHNLDVTLKRIETGKKDNKFKITESAHYAYLSKKVREAQFSKTLTGKAKTDFVMAQANNRARFLYTLPSKVVACKSLLASLPGKTLVFGKGSDCLLDICPNAIVAKNPNSIKDLSDFKNGVTQQCASEIILKQGENIPMLDNIILFAYYSKSKDFIQFVGEHLPIILLNSVNPKSKKIWEYRAKQELCSGRV